MSPPGSDLEVDVRNRGGGLHRHLGRVLGIHKFDETPLADRIEGDDPAAALLGVLERVKKARRVGPGVLPEEQEQVAMIEVG
jgi:hypothetical protein